MPVPPVAVIGVNDGELMYWFKVTSAYVGFTVSKTAGGGGSGDTYNVNVFVDSCPTLSVTVILKLDVASTVLAVPLIAPVLVVNVSPIGKDKVTGATA